MKPLNIVGTLLVALCAACGGGGGGNASQPDAKTTEAIVNGAQDAAANIPESLPPAKKFEGGFVTVEGEAIGYLAGASPKDLAEKIGKEIASDPVKWATLYRILLSDKGLLVSVAGDKIGTSSITGATIYASPSVFVVKLTTNGVVVKEAA